MHDDNNKNHISSNSSPTDNETRLRLLYEIGRILDASGTMKIAAPQILEAICRHLQFELGEIWLLDKGKEVLVLNSTWHLPSKQLEQFAVESQAFEFTIGTGLPGRVWKTNAPVWVEDLRGETDLVRRFIAERAEMQSAFAFPILLGEKFLGAFCFFCKNLCPQDQALLQIFVAVGGNFGQFIKRERVEGDLRQSEENFRALIKASSQAIWTTDIKGQNLEAYGWWENQTGQTRQESTGAGFLQAIHHEDRRRVGDLWQRAMASLKSFETECRIVSKSDEYQHFALRGVPVFNADNSFRQWIGTLTDITARKLAEEKLRDSEERFRNMADNAPVMIWVTDATGYCHYLSQSWYDFTGQTPSTGLGFGWLDATHPEDLKSAEKTFLDANERHATFRVEYRLRGKDGAYIWAIDSAQPRFGRDGEFLGFIGSVIDITERKAAEESLRESEQRYRSLFETMDEGFCLCEMIFDADGKPFDYRFLEVNPVFEAMTGLKNAAGKTARELIPNLEAHWFEIYGKVALTGEAIRFTDGSEAMNRWFDVYASRVGGADSRKFILLFTNITERKLAETALMESQAHLALALKIGRAGTFEWDIKNNINRWSPEIEVMYGVPVGTFEGNYEGWKKRIVPEDAEKVEQGIQNALSEKSKDYEYEFRAVLPDDSRRWFAGRARFDYDEQGEPLRMIGINVDVTGRKEIEFERELLIVEAQKAREIAEQANHAKDEFIALVSHELRSPLNAMLGWTRILQKKKADEKTSQYALDVIAKNALSQSRLIEDLLDIARLGKGKLRIELAPLEFTPFINSAIESVKPAVEAKNIKLTQNLDSSANFITGDGDRLRQVIENLLSNAVKFTPEGGSVSVCLERADEHANLIISDTGQGISKEFLPQIFERFKQADPSTTRRHGGLGIGLSLARDLVELHGGTISAQSAGESKGSTFTVRLPLRMVRPIKENTGKVENMDSQGKLSGFWILAVDDEADAREIISFMLQINGARVTSANSAVEALEILKNAEERIPDILLSDISMPFESGYALLEKIRALPREHGGQIPAVALTAFNRPEDREAAFEAGFQKHLGKPVDMDALIDAIVETISVKQI